VVVIQDLLNDRQGTDEITPLNDTLIAIAICWLAELVDERQGDAHDVCDVQQLHQPPPRSFNDVTVVSKRTGKIETVTEKFTRPFN
jgi:hypothetical protein